MKKRVILLFGFVIGLIYCRAQTGCPDGYENGSNIIKNPDFEQGLAGFYSDYNKTKSKEWFAGSIYVTDNPNLVHNNYKLCLDSVYKGLGQMLIVDGAEDRNKIVWQQKLRIKPNTEYYFGLFYATLFKTNPAQLEITINNTRLPKPFDYHYQHCKGSIFFSFWNSGLADIADIKIRSVSTEVMGNDFVIDQIKFFSCLKKEPVIEKLVDKNPDSALYKFSVKGRKDIPVKSKILIKTVHDSIVSTIQTDSTGKSQVKLNNQMYYIVVQAPDYFKFRDTLQKSTDTLFIKQYTLNPLDSGVIFTLNNLVFERSSSELTALSKRELENVIDLLNDNPTIYLNINGHTDNQGDAVKNYDLSLERVLNVKKYLIEKGINEGRLAGAGFGGTKPLVGFGTDEERKPNRRVEFVIVKRK